MLQRAIDIYNENLPWITSIFDFAKMASFAFHCIVIVFFTRFLGILCYKRIDLSCGSFKVRKKYFDVQNVTNLVSLHFYDGGQVPPDVRKEILQKTTPKIKNLKKKEDSLQNNN